MVAVVGSKGGVGKSTTTISLAVEFHRRGLAVLVVDADPQGTLRIWSDVRDEHVEGADERLQVVHLESSMRPIKGQTLDEMRADTIRRVVPTLGEGYDLCVVDTPPSNTDVQRAAIAIADQVVLPTGPHAADLWGVVPMLELVRHERKTRPALIAAILRNRVKSRSVSARESDEALETAGIPILSARLGHREDFGRATAAGLGVTTFCAWGLAASEVRGLASELELRSEGGIVTAKQERRRRA